MSYTFSRRAFLKYSATTAVAMAGAGLLGGCEYQDPQNPVSKKLPSAITSELQVIAGLKSMKIENGTCTLEVDIESARANPIPLDPYRFSVAVKGTEDKPVYFTLDLDVLDPSVFPGTGTPEPGGVSFEQLRQAATLVCSKLRVVGCDVNELSPHYDPSGVSTIVACKIVREMLLAFQK